MKLQHRLFAIVSILLMAPMTANAVPISYNFDWTGGGGYTMTGMFTGEDTNADNFIRDAEVSSLMFEAFLNGASIGSTSGTPATLAGTLGFDFNFDILNVVIEQGESCQLGQCWNFEGSGIGFANGSSSSFLSQNGQLLFFSGVGNDGTQFTVRDASLVPSPSPIALLGAGFLAWGFRRRQTR